MTAMIHRRCHQRKMRDREAATNPRPVDSVLDYRIEPIAADEANAFILKYEPLQSIGHPVARYGARNPAGELVAIALFGRPAGTNAADICGREYRSKTICLERGACAHWAHPNTASWFIPRALAAAHRSHKWTIFYGYADESVGEIGQIYKSCNWLYLGQGVGRTPGRSREIFRRPDGTVVNDRTLRHLDLKKSEVQDWQVIHTPPKHKYVQFVGDRRERRKLRNALQYPTYPYPAVPLEAVIIDEVQRAPGPLDLVAEGIAIRADMEAGDKSIADAAAAYMRAGQRLIVVKKEIPRGEFHDFLVKHGIGHSQASVCMRIAVGKTTLEQVRADAAERAARYRRQQKIKAQNFRDVTEEPSNVVPIVNGSAQALQKYRAAVQAAFDAWSPQMNERDRRKAREFVPSTSEKRKAA